MTYNILHPNMAFNLEFALDQKRWNELDLLNDIMQFEPLKISKNWASYDLLKLAKNMKWPLIFCILKETSIQFLTSHIK